MTTLGEEKRAAGKVVDTKPAPGFDVTRGSTPTRPFLSQFYYSVLCGRDGRPGRDGKPGKTPKDGEKGEPGVQGPQGAQGPQGDPGKDASITGITTGGAFYIRWGRTDCPNGNNGTEKIYSGRMAGGLYSYSGGSVEYICLPDDPQYDNVAPYSSLVDYVYNAEYESPKFPNANLNNQNPPCVACRSSTRLSVLMIPAIATCPQSWTLEYRGFLMGSYEGHARNSVYKCLDREARGVPGHAGNENGALLYHIYVGDGSGLPCPPFRGNRVLQCVVCSK